MINGMYEKHVACIIDIYTTDTEQPTYLGLTPSQEITSQEREKKKVQKRSFE